MPSSVTLRACGGLPPYTWSKTGDITISNTEGPRTTVTADSENEFPGVVAKVDIYANFKRTVASCDAIFNAQDNGEGIWICYDCDGALMGPCTLHQLDERQHLTSGVECDCSTPYTDDITSNNSACPGSSVTGKAHIVWTDRGLDFNTPAIPITDTGGLFVRTLLQAGVDMRSQAMIDAGCEPCNLSGATVTLTDDAGVSTSFVF
jgi:hypothetical protein